VGSIHGAWWYRSAGRHWCSHQDCSYWRKDSGKIVCDSEGEIREDLRAEIARQGVEIVGLRRELAESRQEMREMTDRANRNIDAWQARATALQVELSEVKAELRAMKLRCEVSNSHD